jgi:hypothetical protein
VRFSDTLLVSGDLSPEVSALIPPDFSSPMSSTKSSTTTPENPLPNGNSCPRKGQPLRCSRGSLACPARITPLDVQYRVQPLCATGTQGSKMPDSSCDAAGRTSPNNGPCVP